MLSHDNLTWDAFSISERVADLKPTHDRIISFLPLSHVAAQVCTTKSKKQYILILIEMSWFDVNDGMVTWSENVLL